MKRLDELQRKLGYRFSDVALLREAMTHPSLAHEGSLRERHNQRLEFLGDAVLQLVLTRELYERFPNRGEGLLTRARAGLVNRRTLARLASELGLGRFLFLSRGEEMNGGRERPSTLADAFEALLGAIYLDAGIESAREFVALQFALEFEELDLSSDAFNPKGELQELLQADSCESPRYQVEATSGPDHDREFECAVYHGGVELGRGLGKSKKSAESRAALDALSRLKHRSHNGDE